MTLDLITLQEYQVRREGGRHRSGYHCGSTCWLLDSWNSKNRKKYQLYDSQSKFDVIFPLNLARGITSDCRRLILTNSIRTS